MYCARQAAAPGLAVGMAVGMAVSMAMARLVVRVRMAVLVGGNMRAAVENGRVVRRNAALDLEPLRVEAMHVVVVDHFGDGGGVLERDETETARHPRLPIGLHHRTAKCFLFQF